MENLMQNVDTLFTNMESFTQKEGLIGKAVTHGDKTFMPVVSVALGYGGGDTQTKNQSGQQNPSNNQMGGGALGFGAKLTTDAIIVIDKQNVTVTPVNASSNMAQIIDKVPQIISSINSSGQQGQQSGQQAQNKPAGQ